MAGEKLNQKMLLECTPKNIYNLRFDRGSEIIPLGLVEDISHVTGFKHIKWGGR